MTNHAKCGVPASDVLIEGGRNGMLLLHRLGGTPADFTLMATALGDDGLTVSCPQMFGHGGSRALLAATTASDWYRSAREALADLEQRCDRIVVGGLGAGALVALQLALDAPQAVQGLVLMSPCAWPDGWAVPWYAPMLRLIRHKTIAGLFRLDEREPFGIKDLTLRRNVMSGLMSDGRPSEDVFGRSAAAHLETVWLAAHQSKRLREARQPTLIFHARCDDRASLSLSLRLQRQLGGRVDVVILEDSYHLVPLDKQAAYVVERTLEFVGEIVAGVKSSTGKSSNFDNLPTK